MVSTCEHTHAFATLAALQLGKHVYCEKPLAPSAAQGRALLQKAKARGLKHGVVEDKIHLPGLQKLFAESELSTYPEPYRYMAARLKAAGRALAPLIHYDAAPHTTELCARYEAWLGGE